MTEKSGGTTPKLLTPLGVIGAFLALVEVALAYTLVRTTGTVQLVLAYFIFGLPVLVFSGFFVILWNRPYVFYPPTEFGGGETPVDHYVAAMTRPAALPATSNERAETVAVESALKVEAATPPNEVDWFDLWKAKRYEEAAADLLARAERIGESPGTALAIGGHILKEKDRALGIAYWEKAIRDHPRELLPYVWYANDLANLGGFAKAIALMDRAVEAGAEKVGAYEAKARYLRMAGDSARAEELLRGLAAERPLDPKPLVALAELLSELGKPDQAVESATKALSLDPADLTALHIVGQRALDQNDQKTAVLTYKRLTSISPDNATYWAYLGNAFLAAGMPDRAMVAYERANELAAGKQAWIVANIGNLYKNQGLFQIGVKFLRQALEIDPKSSYAHDRLSIALKGIAEEDEKETALLLPPGETKESGK